jgi:Family of unknown function (DUF6152)
MKRDALKYFALVVIVLIVCGPTFAHHGNSSYDDKHPIALKGTVTKYVWSNPHVLLYFDVKDDKGNVVHWIAETLAPGRLTRAGWTSNSVKPGDQVTVILLPAKNEAPVGHFHELVFADGKKLDVGEECEYCPRNPNFQAEPKQE